ncbi:MAG: hypothetical protein K2K34_09695 [Oscillospiraceae bacterium]|nr:hypothetical protein [Oscillospiraceae bacterium]
MAKTEKKKGGFGKVLFVLILLVLIALLILYFFGDGLGFGKGSGDGDAVQVNASVSETVSETTEATTVQETVFVEVTVDGDGYLYSNQSYDLDGLIGELNKLEGDLEVHIYLSDTATLAARENLEARLDEKNILHNIIEE